MDAEKQIFDLKQLLEISKSLNSTLDYSILIDSILYTCMAQLKVLKAGLFAKKNLDAEGFCLHRNNKGFDIDHASEYHLSESHGLIRLMSRDYACYTIEEIADRLGNLEGLESVVSLNPVLLVPLKTKGTVNGIIVLGDRIDDEAFDAYEREYALNIASFASIAINNAFLFEMTTTDMMTKLKMKHYFYTVLQERLAASAERKQSLALIMLDIDHFKKFNDSHGHACGDVVLKRVAQCVQDKVRSDDVAARYGGEEFVVLLSDTDLADAVAVAERIRSAVEAMETEYEGHTLRVTLSAGVAVYNPDRDIEMKVFIDRADNALYLSKRNGRNRVSLA